MVAVAVIVCCSNSYSRFSVVVGLGGGSGEDVVGYGCVFRNEVFIFFRWLHGFVCVVRSLKFVFFAWWRDCPLVSIRSREESVFF